MKPFQYLRSPRYLNGLIHKPLGEIDMILLHQVKHRLFGDLAMVLRKKSVQSGKLLIGHGHAPNRSAHFSVQTVSVQPIGSNCDQISSESMLSASEGCRLEARSQLNIGVRRFHAQL
jgi:hypothetical protein